MNRLARERSPYLLQHASNPVDWFAWGDEAFAKARVEDKPIFLSIGYSTCHWCHVMERESFEDEAIAAVLNRHFVSIKVDREERPDVDRVHMAFVQATTGAGGWPMSVWLTPELKPFYGATYFPPSSRWGRPGFIDVLNEIVKAWKTDRNRIVRAAESVTLQLNELERTIRSPSMPGADALERTVRQFHEAFDVRSGGFGTAPKFPRPSELLFLLREHARTGDADALAMVLRTLRAMALGGIRDHLGGGFHRYSVDADWRVPHFEKMLYDQAQLVLAYLEAAQASGDRFYAAVAEDTLAYVRRDMTDAAGGFYSAEDADSVPPEQVGAPSAHRTEGAFYMWRAAEVDALVGADADIVRRHFGVESGGNVPADPQQELTGKNHLYVAQSIDEIVRLTGKSAGEIADTLNRARQRLFEARGARPRPDRDDKVLTAWNGLMIGAFARGARVIEAFGPSGAEPGEWLRETAQRAAWFIRGRLWDSAARTLLRRYRDGDAAIEGYAEDYACLVFGLLELFQADPDPAWLDWAVELQHRQDELFWDEVDGGWFSTTGRDESILLRAKEEYDGAEPSASSMSVLNLIALSHLIGDPAWTERAERTLRCFGPRLEQMGRSMPMMAAALSTYTAGVQQIVIVGDNRRHELERNLARRFLPFAVTVSVSGERQRDLAAILPWIAGMRPIDGRPTVYLCRSFACQRPVTRVEDLGL